MDLPSIKEIKEERLSQMRRKAFAPIALAAMLRGAAKRKRNKYKWVK